MLSGLLRAGRRSGTTVGALLHPRGVGGGGAAPATATAAMAAATIGVASLSSGSSANASAADFYKNIVVVGGSGFVGSEICRQAVARGHRVTSVNSRGRPAALAEQPWAAQVRWVKASVFETAAWSHTVDDATVVVSTVGALGNAATMERLIGDANIAACETAAAQGAAKFVLISAAPMNAASLDFGRKLPLLGAYVNAKHRAEESARAVFGAGSPATSAGGNGGGGGAAGGGANALASATATATATADNGTDTNNGTDTASTPTPTPTPTTRGGGQLSADNLAVPARRASDAFALIRPGFIFGNKGGLPLQLVGVPMRLLFSALGLNRLPGVGPIFFEPPVSVTEVAKAAVACCERSEVTGPVKTKDIQFLARSVNHS